MEIIINASSLYRVIIQTACHLLFQIHSLESVQGMKSPRWFQVPHCNSSLRKYSWSNLGIISMIFFGKYRFFHKNNLCQLVTGLILNEVINI